MPKALLAALALSGAVAAAAVGGAQEAIDRGTINVYVRDVEDDGVVRFVLFDSPDGFPTDMDLARCVQDVVVSGGKASFSFDALPFGDYSVVVLYSENGHFPRPGSGPGGPGGPVGPGGGGGIMTGMSGDSGSMPPTFDECSVSLYVGSLALQVELRTPPEGVGRPHDAPGGVPPGM